jgi:ribose transport system ATP-binding protein
LRGLAKRFPGVVALDAVDLAVAVGEIHAIVGENGAGKSTLIKILCGAHTADQGEIWFAGAAFRPQTPLAALQAGIRVVYQEFNLLPYLSVAENLLFERLPRRLGVILDRRELNGRATEILRQVGLDVAPNIRVERLGIAQRQLLEIGRALSGASRLLILDEPTATLTPRETGRLFAIIRSVRAAGVTVIYISHHLQEIFTLCDTVTVLRNGRRMASLPVASTSAAELVRLMVGRQLQEAARAADATAELSEKARPLRRAALQVRDLKVLGGVHPISFSLNYGEVLGIAGLVGSGRTEVLRAIFGADARSGGEIFRDDKRVAISDPRSAVRNGICLLTENRKEEGLVLPMAARVNITLADLRTVSRAGLLDVASENRGAQKWISELDIRLASPDQPARDLSGGNQQKLVMSKWLFRHSAVLMLDEPTRGIDVGAKAEIYALLRRLAMHGKALLLVSSELPELMVLCNRILVLSRGRLVGSLERHEFDEERILSLAYSEYIAASKTHAADGDHSLAYQ